MRSNRQIFLFAIILSAVSIISLGQVGVQQNEMTGSARGQHSRRHLSGRNDTIPCKIRTPYPTIIHLAVEWEIEGDDNLNSVVTVHYRAVGDRNWKQGMPLRRVPKQTWYNEPPGKKEVLKFTWANKHSGTIFDLRPGTEYEVHLHLNDPDGGHAERTIRARTRPLPKAKNDAPMKRANPKTFAEVVQSAQPGDVLLLDAGNYGYFKIPHSGEPGKPIVIRSASVQSADGDAIYLDADNPPGGRAYANHQPLRSREGEVIFEGISLQGCKHVYLEGLVSFGTVTLWHAEDCAVSRCRVYGIWGITSSARQGLEGWLPNVAARLKPFTTPTNTDTVPRAKCTNCYIADNEVIGITPWRRPTIGAKGKNMGEGIEIAGPGNVICYNRVTGFRDNISFMEGVFAVDQHCNDIYNNDIEGGVDDGVEADYYMSNCRILRNRFTNCHRGISAGPGMGGPLYIVRNVMYNLLTHPFDTNRACSGAVVLHNTSVKTGHAVSWNYGSSYLFFYNNLCIGGGDLRGRATIAILVEMSVDLNAADIRVLPRNQVPNDRRLGPLKELRGDYFPFEVPKSRRQWEQRKDDLKRRILVATGLLPMPDKTPLNPVIHGCVKHDNFTVDKVYFESYPGHFVTGLLFKPKHIAGHLPGVLCPHGHGGRLQDYGEKGIREQIVRGAERFELSGRYPKLARCAQLARMGCVTFIFDMVGYADSTQISRKVAHRFSKQRPEFDTKENWGFFATQAELRLQSIMGLQTWNSIRALDFLCGLPEVDSKRIGVTGGSGGGTQTIILCAIDPRPIVAFPNGMVSTDMQGGCTCENCSLLRIGTGNVELAALFAPKPQGMTAANDWTKEMMTKGYPELKQLYAMLGAQKNVICHSLTHFPHNYNYVSRALMYSWFNKHLTLGLEEPVVEEDWPPLTKEEWSVWNDKHPRPADDPDHERQMLRYVTRESDRQIAALIPTDAKSLARFREIVGGAFETIIGRTLKQVGPINHRQIEQLNRDGYQYRKGLLGTKRHGEELPVVSFLPERTLPNKQVVIWIDGQGKSALADRQSQIIPEIRQLLDVGMAVLSADLLYQGKFLSEGKPLTEARASSNPRAYAGYTFGYNHPLFAQRVHDILTLVSFARSDQYRAKHIYLVGVKGAGPWVAAARAIMGNEVDSAAIDTGGFRFANLASYRDVNFLPGSVKYGDLPVLLALSAPDWLWICGETEESLEIVTAAYVASRQLQHLSIHKIQQQDVSASIVQWLKQMKGRF